MFNHAVFQTNEGQPYIETYLSIIGNSVHFQEVREGVYQGAVLVTMSIQKGDSIVYVDKIRLKSPEVLDTTKALANFMHQDRIPLSNGTYSIALSVKDENVTAPPLEVEIPIEVFLPSNLVHISDINFLDSYTKTKQPSSISKAGYDLVVQVPYGDHYFPEYINELKFYGEIYNLEKVVHDATVVRYFIESSETSFQISRYVRTQKMEPKDVAVILAGFDITELPSGNYNFVIEVLDREQNRLAEEKLYFQRSNPNVQIQMQDVAGLALTGSFVQQYDDIEELALYVRSLSPIASPNEQQYAKNQLKKMDLEDMQRFFHGFWMNRNYYNPGKAWSEYLDQLNVADDLFATPQSRGFETDRGRVFLKYGRPSYVDNREYEPSSYPYQIWEYYNLGNQANRKFIFGNFEIATNDYRLIHSNAIGEISNPRWKVLLNSRNNQVADPDQTNTRDQFGSWLNDNDNDFATPTGPQ